MAVYGNFKGTTQPGFTVGKTGAASIYGNPSSPPSSPSAGDVWMDSANTALKVYDGTEWSQGNFVGNLEGFIEIEVIAGENLVKGDVVYVSGSSGNTPEVSKAQANSTNTMPAVGICEQTINSGNSGFIVVQGLLTGINTSAYSEGDVLYVSDSVAGEFTSTAPTGESNRIQNVGKVINSSNGGSILVTGAGRFNATPALNNGNIFIGNTNNEAVTVGLDVFLTATGYLKNVVEDTTPQLGGDLDAQGNNILSVDTLRINTDGAGLRMTSVGAFDNTGGSVAGNFRVFATNDLILSAGGNSGNAIVINKTTQDAVFAGTIRVHDAFTFPSTDGSADQYLKTDGSGQVSWADGPIGYTGSKGDTGFTGSIGFTGSKGDTGFTGSKGDTGFNGSTGFTGSKGDTGFTGSQGDIGFTGSIGNVQVGGAFVHTQSSAATTWTINHNLDSQYLNVEVIDVNGNSLVGTYGYPTISFTNANTTTLTFTTSTAGYAAVTSGGGQTGSQGNQGIQGFTGSKGDAGFIGSQGLQGVPGFTGSKGDKGFTGSQGDQGVIGFTGSQGTQGVIGFTGSKGDKGFTGSQGNQGVIGFTGSKGDRGNIGFTGSQGIQGITGFTGSQGTQGVIGFTGSQGDQGVIGFTGSKGATGFTGSQGDQGVIGFTGSQGDQGVTGFTGSQGNQGIQGFTGSKGDTGFTGSLGFTGSQGGFGGATFEYNWSTDTTVSDPGAGNVKINNANLTSGTTLSIDDTDATGTDIQQFLRTIDDSTSAIKGHFRMANKLNSDDFALYTISAISEQTGYFEVTVAYVDGSATSFTNGEELIMTFARTGDKGDTGFTGSRGDTGFTGSQGAVGFTGSKGDQGVTGFTGSQGDQGVIGFTGSQGDQGVIGFTGSKGDKGFTGSQGDQGVIGFTGSRGDRGNVGFTGSQGIQGITGFTGSQGTQGVIGFTGSQGDQGDIGFTGSQGAIGYTGSQGDQGVIGFTGSQGDIGFTGSQGVQGDIGVPGFTGSQGNVAQAGAFVYTQSSTSNFWDITHNLNVQYLNVEVIDNTGNSLVGTSNYPIVNFTNNNRLTLTFSTAISGYAAITSGGGPQGNVGYSGSAGFTGSQGFNGSRGFTGSRGTIGYTGSQGDTGDQGVIGFTGSRGVIGYTGSQGLQGVTGFTGSKGDQGDIGYTGSKGDQGLIGFTGSNGDTGFTGSQGNTVIGGAFVHTQGSAATTWTINHNLNAQYLNVEVIDVNGNSLVGTYGYPSVTFTNSNTTTLTFQSATAGYAALTSGGGQTGSQGTAGFTGSKGDTGFTGSIGFTGSQGGFGGATFEYDWSTNTTVSDPGAGTVKINNANLTSGTTLSIDDTDATGTDIQQFLRTIDDSTSAIKGHFRMANKLNADDFALYTISAISEQSGYFEVTVSYVDGSATSFTNGEELIMTFARTGDKGDTGFTGSKGDTGFTGSQGDQGVTGFTGSQGDQGVIGFTGSQGDQGVIGFTGSQGDQGVTGFTGSQGDQGVTGFTGSRGVIGYTGSQGNQGVIGFTGSKGDTGVIGFTGSKGDTGFGGSVGFTGSKGDIGFTGSKGDTGFGGSVGFNGSTGINTYGVDYNFDSSTTEADPGSGDFRFSIDWTTGSATNSYEAYISDADANGNGVLGILNTLNDSTNDKKALCVLYKKSDPSVNARFYVTGTTTNTGWRTLDVTYIDEDGWSNVNNGDALFMGISIVGDQGDLGFTGSQGFTGSTGLGGEQGETGFTGSQGDQGVTGFTGSTGNNGFNGSTGLQGVVGYTGSKGDTGFTGSNGADSSTLDSVTTNGNTTTNDITVGNVSLPDSKYLLMGTNDDLEIYHDGSVSYIKDVGTGSLVIQSNNMRIQDVGQSETAFSAADGIATLYYQNSEKLVTVTGGVSITGDATATGTVQGATITDGTASFTSGALTGATTGSFSGQVTAGTLQTTTLTSGSNGTAGTVTGDWTLTAGSTWEATYADLAEKYTTDGPYEAGTVMKFGGEAELTESDTNNDTRVAGVISDAPAFTMNGGIEGQYLALAGRVPVKVVGTVRPGDLLVASDTAGHAIVNNNAASGTIIGKAITSDANGVCEALVILM